MGKGILPSTLVPFNSELFRVRKNLSLSRLMWQNAVKLSGLNNRNYFPLQCWRLDFCDWGAGKVSFQWGPFSGLADNHLLLRPHVMERGCHFLEGLVLPGEGPPSWPHLTFITSLKAPQPLQLHGLQHVNFAGGTRFHLQKRWSLEST